MCAAVGLLACGSLGPCQMESVLGRAEGCLSVCVAAGMYPLGMPCVPSGSSGDPRTVSVQTDGCLAAAHSSVCVLPCPGSSRIEGAKSRTCVLLSCSLASRRTHWIRRRTYGTPQGASRASRQPRTCRRGASRASRQPRTCRQGTSHALCDCREGDLAGDGW